MNGGYFLIDCGGLDLIKGSTPQTITGLYAQCKRAMDLGKPVIACNMVWDTQGAVTPLNVMLVDFGDYIIGTAATLQIVVQNTDVVTINNLVGE